MMQIKTSYFYSRLYFTILCLFTLISVSACSNHLENSKVVSTHKKDNKSSSSSTVPNSNSLPHIHPSNPCTTELSHTHEFQKTDHQHSYDCENTNKFVKNAHIHPATSKNKRMRHVHPNGASIHSHIR